MQAGGYSLTTSALLGWELCLSLKPASVTYPSFHLFPLTPCSSPLLSLCPSVSPSSLSHLSHPLLQPLTESHYSPSSPFPNTCPLLPWPLPPSPPLGSLPSQSVCLSSGIVSFSSPACPPLLASPVCPHHPLCLPQLSGKAVVIYELWTGPAVGAGGPRLRFPGGSCLLAMAG